MHYNAPAIMLSVRYDLMDIAQYVYSIMGPVSIEAMISTFPSLVESWAKQISYDHFKGCMRDLLKEIHSRVPIATGALLKSIKGLKDIERSLPFQRYSGESTRDFRVFSKAEDGTNYYWEEDITMPSQMYLTMVIHSTQDRQAIGDLSYVEPVEHGSSPHLAPLGRLAVWTRLKLGDDPSLVFAVRNIIKGRGTPLRAMFHHGWIVAFGIVELTQREMVYVHVPWPNEFFHIDEDRLASSPGEINVDGTGFVGI